jgi:hypothetical protein
MDCRGRGIFKFSKKYWRLTSSTITAKVQRENMQVYKSVTLEDESFLSNHLLEFMKPI